MDADTSKKIAFPMIGCGAVLVLISILAFFFGAFHVFLDPRGAISADEALPAMIGGGCCGMSSLVIVVVSVFLLVRSRKREETPSEE